jgi:CMP-N,N'-diacetyllegionaminic acid synthase
MKHGRRILAVVPARSGSKGIPDKNMQQIAGRSLIALTGEVLNADACSWIDRRIISTDSERYAGEGRQHGLDAPFLRPPELSSDNAGAVETLCHAVLEMERRDGVTYDVILIVEPTCPFRQPEDINGVMDLLAQTDAGSAVTVSRVDTKYHPHKVLRVDDTNVISFYAEAGAEVKQRQSLEPLFYRNGACYALSRACLMDEQRIFTTSTRAHLVERLLLNIDEPEEIELARYYAETRHLPVGHRTEPS